MRPDPIIEFGLGLAAIVVALAAALLFAFPPSWLDSRRVAVAVFSNVGSLGEGADVRENGYVVGNVVSIDAATNRYLVHMKLRPEWRMAAGQALTVEETNPLRAASLSVAHICKTVVTFDSESMVGCCPDKFLSPVTAGDEMALASCGRTPSLIDVALATTLKVSFVTNELRVAMGLEQANKAIAALPGDPGDKPGLVSNANAMMTSIKALTNKASGLVDDRNKASLSSALNNFSSGSKTMNDMMRNNAGELKASMTGLASILQTTATTLPVIVGNMQKASEDLKAVSAEIRREPTSLLRQRKRSDPRFVEPAADK